MASQESFVDQVADGYEHLYDTVYLRTHPLTCLVTAGEGQSRRQVAWRLHQLLLDAIDDLDPGPGARAFSREWRRHRLMVLRFCDGLSAQAIAERLSISPRSYYRELREAFEALSIILDERQRLAAREGAADAASGASGRADRMSLLRMEAGRLATEGRRASLGNVVVDVTLLVREMAHDSGIAVQALLREEDARVEVNRGAVRQVLLGAISLLMQTLAMGVITIGSSPADDGAILTLTPRGVARSEADGIALPENVRERLAVLEELGRAQSIALSEVSVDGLSGLRVHLAHRAAPTILIADDNDDTLRLLESYLSANGYETLMARNGAETLAMAERCLPDAITLDLMMPGQDGWDVLQTLTNRPETQHIPVIVNSVLSAGALALSLGANLFLEKPVSEETLLAALAALGL